MNRRGRRKVHGHPGVTGSLAATLAVLLLAGLARAGEDTGRIREKCVELRQKVLAAEFATAGEGKESERLRVYKDFDYLLKASKTDNIREAAAKAADPTEQDRLRRLHDYLMGERVTYAVVATMDNMARDARSRSTKVGGATLTLRSFPILVPNEPDRANRRNWYLATRELLDNHNVFLLNLQIDLDRATQEHFEGRSAAQEAFRRADLDPTVVDSLAARLLRGTREEYLELLTWAAASELDGMVLKDLRAYDVPRLLRFASLDASFPKGKEVDAAAAWARNWGIDVNGQRYLKMMLDPATGKSPDPGVFPVNNERDTRMTMARLGGLPDYLDYLRILGEAEFYYHIDPSLGFEDRTVGSGLLARTYGMLFQRVLLDPAWREAFLKVKPEQKAAVEKALRLSRLYDLRESAGRHLYQSLVHRGTKVGASEYQKQMEDALLFTHTSSEGNSYLQAEDYGESALNLVGAVLAEQLQRKLAAEFSAEWYTRPDVGTWLKQQWARGFQVKGSELAASLGLGSVDAGVLLGSAAPAEDGPPAGDEAVPKAEAAPGD